MKRMGCFLLFFLPASVSFACTTFCINQNGHIVFGRNYDWVTGAGIVYSNQRGLVKTSYPIEGEPSIQWTSLYGSISFNQYGKEFPTGGMNEKGLVVELMWLDGTTYPKSDTRPAVEVLQWIQFQLDNAANVDEVIASDKKIRIRDDGTPLHYLVADAGGNVASIEFLEGKMIVHRKQDLPFPVLTNTAYEESAQTAKKFVGNTKDPAALDNSLERYVKACRMVTKVNELPRDKSLTDYAFSILDFVAQGDFTKWSIVYDISNKKVLFKTEGFSTVKSISLSSFNFTCSAPYKMYNMNQPPGGDIGTRFTTRDNNLQVVLLEKAIQESKSRVNISNNTKHKILQYQETIRCK